MIDEEIIDKYIDEICRQCNIVYKPNEKKELYDSIRENIYDKINEKIINILPESKRQEYIDMVTENEDISDDEIVEFYKNNVKNLDKKIDEITLEAVSETMVDIKAIIIKNNVDYSKYMEDEDEDEDDGGSVEDKLKQ
jgi:hypothetical protein